MLLGAEIRSESFLQSTMEYRKIKDDDKVPSLCFSSLLLLSIRVLLDTLLKFSIMYTEFQDDHDVASDLESLKGKSHTGELISRSLLLFVRFV